MKEHPIPQDITGYRFHIVGSMTLKQFGEVLIGVIISFIIYQTNLVFIIKWPLIVLFFGGGLLSAFIPIEERPISHWITTFMRILYKPTQFFWRRTHNIPPAFLYKGNEENLITVKEIDLTPARRQRIKEFLTSTKAISPDEEDLTPQEQRHISSVLELFQVVSQPSQAVSETVVQKPELTVRVRSMRVQADIEETQLPVEQDTSWQELMAAGQEHTIPTPEVILPSPLTPHLENEDASKSVYLKTEEVAQNIAIPEDTIISIRPSVAEEAEKVILTPQNTDQGERAFISSNQHSIQEQKDASKSTAATFNTALPFPDKPTIANKLVGMVLTNQQEIIPNAIVEIATEDGHVVRAVKTNALGQFFITTPLKSGKYLVNVQKEGFTFELVRIELNNNIVEPLEIKSVG